MKSFKLYVEVTSASQRLAGNLKRSGFDVNARHDYWTKKAKELEDKRKEYEKNNPTPVVKEDGGACACAAPTNSVAGVAGSGDSRLPAAQREPGVSKKKNPILKGMFRRKPPKA